MPVSPQERARRLAAYEATHTDAEAAALVGLTPTGFALWRYKEEIPAKAYRSRIDLEARRQIWATARSDREAAGQLGLSVSGWRVWRRAQGWPAPGPRFRASAGWEEAYRVTSCDAEAAAMLGIHKETFARLRRAGRLPAKRRANR